MKKITAVLLLFTFLLTGCQKPRENAVPQRTHLIFDALDTVISVTLYGPDQKRNQQIAQESQSYCNKLEEIFSFTLPESELYKLNQQPAGTYPVSKELGEVIERSLYFAQISEHTFDPTIGSVSRLWTFDQKSPKLPSPEAIEEALKTVDHRLLTFKEGQVTKKADNVLLDLGAIAKGYIGDKLRDFFLEEGVSYGTISLGGDVITFGEKPDKSPWVIGISEPSIEAQGHIATLSISSGSVVTSGTYQRYFTMDEKRYHHILNPKTGYPMENSLVSVTVWAATGMDADALSTVCFILGPEKGAKLLEDYDLGHAVFIDVAGEFYTTKDIPGFKKI